jgi:hypothetical protein
MAKDPTTSPEGYDSLRSEKQRIDNARLKAALSINRELVLLYCQLGWHRISHRAFQVDAQATGYDTSPPSARGRMVRGASPGGAARFETDAPTPISSRNLLVIG